MNNELRNIDHRRSSAVEKVLQELKELLESVDEEVCGSYSEDKRPTIHILGCARSGTTLLHQLLVRKIKVSYPTNFLSRFFYAPVLGAKLQFLLNDLDFNDEILSSFPDFGLSSKLGKTKGPMSPHEFWYFWRNIFDVNDNGFIENINNENLSRFYLKVDSITKVLGRPFVLKSMIAQHKMSEFLRYRPEDKIVYIKRKTEFNAQSLLQARRDYFSDIEKWYSFMPLNYQVSGSPYKQVVDQVSLTNEMIEADLSKVNPASVFTVDYEELGSKLNELIDWIGFEKRESVGIQNESIIPRNKINDSREFKEIMKYIKDL